MSTTRQQALEHHRRQSEIASEAANAVGSLIGQRRPWSEILTRVASYQLAAAAASVATMAGVAGGGAAVAPAAFAGISSAGFPISEPMVVTIDRVAPAPAEPLPAPWWPNTAGIQLPIRQLVASEVQDAGRSAGQAQLFATGSERYVRVLSPPSCKRCAVLAGRIYRTDRDFNRHPGCDCQNWPVDSWEDAHDAGLVSSPEEMFRKGQIRDLTAAERSAIEDGADISKVINSLSGIYSADIFGHRVSATRYGTTKRSQWRKQNPTRLVRLRPESIYRIADGNHDEAVRLLGLYGYLT